MEFDQASSVQDGDLESLWGEGQFNMTEQNPQENGDLLHTLFDDDSQLPEPPSSIQNITRGTSLPDQSAPECLPRRFESPIRNDRSAALSTSLDKPGGLVTPPHITIYRPTNSEHGNELTSSDSNCASIEPTQVNRLHLQLPTHALGNAVEPIDFEVGNPRSLDSEGVKVLSLESRSQVSTIQSSKLSYSFHSHDILNTAALTSLANNEASQFPLTSADRPNLQSVDHQSLSHLAELDSGCNGSSTSVYSRIRDRNSSSQPCYGDHDSHTTSASNSDLKAPSSSGIIQTSYSKQYESPYAPISLTSEALKPEVPQLSQPEEGIDLPTQGGLPAKRASSQSSPGCVSESTINDYDGGPCDASDKVPQCPENNSSGKEGQNRASTIIKEASGQSPEHYPKYLITQLPLDISACIALTEPVRQAHVFLTIARIRDLLRNTPHEGCLTASYNAPEIVNATFNLLRNNVSFRSQFLALGVKQMEADTGEPSRESAPEKSQKSDMVLRLLETLQVEAQRITVPPPVGPGPEYALWLAFTKGNLMERVKQLVDFCASINRVQVATETMEKSLQQETARMDAIIRFQRQQIEVLRKTAEAYKGAADTVLGKPRYVKRSDYPENYIPEHINNHLWLCGNLLEAGVCASLNREYVQTRDVQQTWVKRLHCVGCRSYTPDYLRHLISSEDGNQRYDHLPQNPALGSSQTSSPSTNPELPPYAASTAHSYQASQSPQLSKHRRVSSNTGGVRPQYQAFGASQQSQSIGSPSNAGPASPGIPNISQNGLPPSQTCNASTSTPTFQYPNSFAPDVGRNPILLKTLPSLQTGNLIPTVATSLQAPPPFSPPSAAKGHMDNHQSVDQSRPLPQTPNPASAGAGFGTGTNPIISHIALSNSNIQESTGKSRSYYHPPPPTRIANDQKAYDTANNGVINSISSHWDTSGKFNKFQNIPQLAPLPSLSHDPTEEQTHPVVGLHTFCGSDNGLGTRSLEQQNPMSFSPECQAPTYTTQNPAPTIHSPAIRINRQTPTVMMPDSPADQAYLYVPGSHMLVNLPPLSYAQLQIFTRQAIKNAPGFDNENSIPALQVPLSAECRLQNPTLNKDEFIFNDTANQTISIPSPSPTETVSSTEQFSGLRTPTTRSILPASDWKVRNASRAALKLPTNPGIEESEQAQSQQAYTQQVRSRLVEPTINSNWKRGRPSVKSVAKELSLLLDPEPPQKQRKINPVAESTQTTLRSQLGLKAHSWMSPAGQAPPLNAPIVIADDDDEQDSSDMSSLFGNNNEPVFMEEQAMSPSGSNQRGGGPTRDSGAGVLSQENLSAEEAEAELEADLEAALEAGDEGPDLEKANEVELVREAGNDVHEAGAVGDVGLGIEEWWEQMMEEDNAIAAGSSQKSMEE